MRVDKSKIAAVNDLFDGYAGSCTPSNVTKNHKGEIISLVFDVQKTLNEMIEDLNNIYT